jgi:hypothetical protein
MTGGPPSATNTAAQCQKELEKEPKDLKRAPFCWVSLSPYSVGSFGDTQRHLSDAGEYGYYSSFRAKPAAFPLALAFFLLSASTI